MRPGCYRNLVSIFLYSFLHIALQSHSIKYKYTILGTRRPRVFEAVAGIPAETAGAGHESLEHAPCERRRMGQRLGEIVHDPWAAVFVDQVAQLGAGGLEDVFVCLGIGERGDGARLEEV